MKPTLLTLIFLVFALFSFAQRVKYPPAPSSVYKPFQKNTSVSSQLKSALWSNDVSDMNEWSFSNTSSPSLDWLFDTDASVISVSGPFQSATSSNGFIAFLSDTTQGSSSDAYAEYTGPQIDLTGEPNIRIQFEQQFINDSNERMLEVSQDGITWTPFSISDGLAPTGAKENDLTSIDISSAAGNASDLHLRFHFSGTQEGYWAIDDIQLRTIDSVDLRAVSLDWGTTGAWGVRMPYYRVITSQVQPIEFCAVVANDGLNDLDSAVYAVQVSPTSFWSSEFFSIQAGDVDTVCVSTPFFMNGNWNYTANQTVNVNQPELNVSNNEFENIEFIEDQGNWAIHARDDLFTGVQGGILSPQELGVEYSVGNIFDIFSQTATAGINVHLHPDAQPGSTIVGYLYELDQMTNEWNLVNQTPEYIITQSDLDADVYVYFGWFPFDLTPYSTYLVMAGAYSSGDSSSVFATSGKSKPNTSFYSSSWDANGPILYYLTETPMVRLWFYPGSLDEYHSDFNFLLAPNPTSESTTLSFDLPSSSHIAFEIIDLSGKIVNQTESSFFSAGENQFILHTEDLNNGVYLVKFQSDFGSTTKRLIIQH